MTIIAWDGRCVAADKRCTLGGGLAATVTKIERFGVSVLAISGSTGVGLEMREWFKAGADPETFPDSAREDEASLLVFTPGKWPQHYTCAPHALGIEEPFFAWGSGRDFAVAALALGRNARQAVELACRFQTDCGNGVDELGLHPQLSPQ